MSTSKKTYGKAIERASRPVKPPALQYEACDPKRYNPPIALIGCGGISQMHLQAYRDAGYNVAALCDRHPERVEARRREFFPKARVYTDSRDVFRRDDIEVVDITIHPESRYTMIEEALRSGKHVLSQKPFVLDLRRGQKLADLAERLNLKLAVNQNGRWAPHFSYIRQAISKSLIGNVLNASLAVHWNHDWTAGSKFDAIKHLVLYDFGIHWFDIVTCFMGGKPARRVYATTARAAGQQARPPLLAEAIVEYDDAQASLVFDGFCQFGPSDTTIVSGTKGSIRSTGPDFDHQSITLYTARGYSSPKLHGTWFPGGFHGAMAELLCAIEQNRQPIHSARNNLASLALCFAACKSADTRRPQIPGRVQRLPGE